MYIWHLIPRHVHIQTPTRVLQMREKKGRKKKKPPYPSPRGTICVFSPDPASDLDSNMFEAREPTHGYGHPNFPVHVPLWSNRSANIPGPRRSRFAWIWVPEIPDRLPSLFGVHAHLQTRIIAHHPRKTRKANWHITRGRLTQQIGSSGEGAS
jgi:hypothetical protein